MGENEKDAASTNSFERLIVLPADITQDRRQRLKAKLREYKERVKPNQPPEIDVDARYKAGVLEAVLTSGKVSTNDLYIRLKQEVGVAKPDVFINACRVIEDYINTGGQGVDHPSRPFDSIPIG